MFLIWIERDQTTDVLNSGDEGKLKASIRYWTLDDSVNRQFIIEAAVAQFVRSDSNRVSSIHTILVQHVTNHSTTRRSRNNMGRLPHNPTLPPPLLNLRRMVRKHAHRRSPLHRRRDRRPTMEEDRAIPPFYAPTVLGE